MKRIRKEKWAWIIYIILFGGVTLRRVYSFFHASEPIFFYHHLLMILSVHQGYWPWPYVLTITTLLLNILTTVFLFVYLTGKKTFSSAFILCAMIIRLLSDLRGYNYEWNFIRALYHESPYTSLFTALKLALWLLPSYLAMWDYAAKKTGPGLSRTGADP